ncbi:DMT family transporter [Pseudomaricurvus sp. HS19]|uniref:DMT family transporter n=1 Tax=Pseudomaricurvus sp. HS19 TaxID=2692626 RepID=UPI0013711ADA|nr:DMT family transporter [Pseudomaricurvus sp. HS19]MYM63292.1 EamA family transporter [Pseudomaricurvus sp. HS19]
MKFVAPPAELAVFSAACIFGLAGVFVKLLEMPVTVAAGFRLFVPGVLLLLFAPSLRRRVFTHHSPLLLLASAITVVRILLWVAGLSWAPLSKAVVVLFSWPLLFTLMSIVAGQERPSLRTLALLGLAVAGLGLLQHGTEWRWDSRETLGLLSMFVSALLFAGNMFIYRQALQSRSPMEVVLRDCLLGGVVFLPFILWYLPGFSVPQVVGGVGYGVLIGLLGYGLLYYGLARVKPSVASVLAYGEVLSAVLLGVVVFDERLSAVHWLGAGCILLAAALARRAH